MRFPAVVDQLRKIAGRDAVLDRPEDLMLYEYDAGVRKCTPAAVVFPQTTEQVSQIMRLASSAGFPVVARGAGTGLSGGAISPEGGVVLAFARMNRILEVDAENMRAVVQPGVVNQQLSDNVAHLGLYFAPDPSSQKACTIGGNVAENSGGPHTLAYGVTVNHVTGLTVVLPSGEVVHFGGKAAECSGYDLTGFFVGSEGTLGVVTEITVKLLRRPERVATLLGIFETVDDGARTVSAITAAGITPAALEMLDGWTLRAVEAACHAGYPLDAGAVLLIELEGLGRAGRGAGGGSAGGLLRSRGRARCGARKTRTSGRCCGRAARTPSRRWDDWHLRTIRRMAWCRARKIPAVLQFIEGVAKKYGLRIGNIFHAGDGNLHPLILFDPRDPAQLELVQVASRDILEYCVSVGGSITGEHGVGLEKRDLMPLLFTDDDLDVMLSLHNAFNAAGVLNPGKLFPTTRMCRETRGPSQQSGAGSGGHVSASWQFRSTSTRELRAICGEENVRERPSRRSVRESCFGRGSGSGTGVWRMSTGCSVGPAGGSTERSAAELRTDILLHLNRLTEVEHYDHADLTVGVGAGTTVAQLNAMVGADRLMFAADPPLPERCTIGGLLATASHGPLRHGYGAVARLSASECAL